MSRARLERRHRRALLAIAVGLVAFWAAVAVALVGWFGDGDSTELGSAWPVVERCSVVMPEDLDR